MLQTLTFSCIFTAILILLIWFVLRMGSGRSVTIQLSVWRNIYVRRWSFSRSPPRGRRERLAARRQGICFDVWSLFENVVVLNFSFFFANSDIRSTVRLAFPQCRWKKFLILFQVSSDWSINSFPSFFRTKISQFVIAVLTAKSRALQKTWWHSKWNFSRKRFFRFVLLPGNLLIHRNKISTFELK